MNMPNQKSWEAVKGLVREAEGNVKVFVLFAVQKIGFMDRMIIRCFAAELMK